MTLKCDCCGFVGEFADGEDAYRAGWDCPPHFTGYVSCNLCPGSYIVLGETYLHEPDHERWAIGGRPAEWQIPRDRDGLIITGIPRKSKAN